MISSPARNHSRHAFAISQADTVSFILGSADYFDAFIKMSEVTEHRLVIVGWELNLGIYLHRESDINGRIEFKNRFAEHLQKLVQTRQTLDVYILVWDSPIFFNTIQGRMRNLAFAWAGHPRIHLVFEQAPFSVASLHEKFVLFDDWLAFVGGMDMTSRRWDTFGHLIDDQRRRDPLNFSYGAYHDIQAAVTGPVVKDICRLAAERWRAADKNQIKQVPQEAEPPDPRPPLAAFYTMSKLPVEIQLTRPAVTIQEKGVFQIQRHYREAIAQARELIYIENQFFAEDRIAGMLGGLLIQDKGPQIIILIPHEIPELIGSIVVGNKSARILHSLIEADKHGRLSLITPYCDKKQQQPIKIHSKLMVIDNQSLAVGSANLVRRSFHLDYETNLVFKALAERDKESFSDFFFAMIGQHAQCHPQNIKDILQEKNGNWQSTLREVADKSPVLMFRSRDSIVENKAIPQINETQKPVGAERVINTLLESSSGKELKRRILFSLGCLLTVLLVILGIYLANIYASEENEFIQRVMARIQGLQAYSWRSMIWASGLVVLTTIIMIPTVVIILTYVALWGEVYGAITSMAGMLLSAHFFYLIGRLLELPYITRLEIVRKTLAKIRSYGVWGVALTRIVPTGPFILVNIATGAVGIKLRDMFLGSVIGFMPGIVMIASFSRILRQVWEDPSGLAVVIMVLISVAYLIIVRYAFRLLGRAFKRLGTQSD